MFVQSKNPVYMDQYLALLLAWFNGNTLASGTWNSLFVNLVIGGPAPLRHDANPADFVVATFPGYGTAFPNAAQSLENFPNGLGAGSVFDTDFVCNAPVGGGGQSIIGWVASDNAGNFTAAEYFAAPITIIRPGDFIQLSILLGWPFSLPSG